MVRRTIKKILLVGLIPVSIAAGQYANAEGPLWQGSVPSIFGESADWERIVDQLMEHHFYFGALASAHRMIAFFPDINSKLAAFKAIIEIMDRGYPYSPLNAFSFGDIDPADKDYNFFNSYYLYKAIANVNAGSLRWAEGYFARLDKEKFGKYLFYQAIEAYKKEDLKTCEQILVKILKDETGDPKRLNFVSKVSRSLARVYFDQGQYEKSLEIYKEFLLRVNPVVPLDWLEAAWCLYHLKRLPESLGALYNLESNTAFSSDGSINLEKYTMRALIYRQLCATAQAEALIASFDRTFGATLTGIKRGEALTSFPLLSLIDIPENEDFREIEATLGQLKLESQRISDWSSNDRNYLEFIYSTEIFIKQKQLEIYREAAIERSARALVNLAEELKFLKFDVVRAKDDPDEVFRNPSSLEAKGDRAVHSSLKAGSDDEAHYVIHWFQFGDYWRDERNTYRGVLESQCEK